MYNMYYQNGVIITPNVAAKGDTATITYKGLLYSSGADSVYLHAGYGDRWSNTVDIKMQRTNDGFEARLPVNSKDTLNLSFKDSAANWDNNSGRDYSFHVEGR